jgi:hypothetical protein
MASESKSGGEWGWIIPCLFLGWLFGDVWHSKLRYVIQYQVSYDQVVKAKRPHDCDWLTAPLGDKNCQYEPQVQTVRTAISTTGSPIVSYDDGKTWSANEGVPPVKNGVYISWQKTDE